jgi:sulfoxide reductase heme-binding subunit YedZ
VTAAGISPYMPWLASRSAGVVAYGAVSVSVILGLLMSTRWLEGRDRARMRPIHEHAALIGLVALALHAGLLLFDGWLKAGPVDVVVPFALGYRRVFTGLGVLAAYGAVLFGLSFYLRSRIGARRWRRLHRASFVVWVLASVHAIGAGSDAATPFMRGLLGASAGPILALLGLRAWQAMPAGRLRARERV